MNKITFKQFNTFIEAPLEEGEQLDEIFGMFKNEAEKKAAELKKLELLAARGDEQAKMTLRKMERDAERAAAGKKASRAVDDAKLKQAQAHSQAADQGSSKAWRDEGGTAGKGVGKLVWDPAANGGKGDWVLKTLWHHVGKHD